MITINGKIVNKDIKKLDLSNNKLTQLQVEIGQLTQLTVLDVSNNKLTHLSVEIGQLKRLTTLYLSDNKFIFFISLLTIFPLIEIILLCY